MALDQLYQSKILDHNKSPNNHFVLQDATHCAPGMDALCGDDIRIWLRIEDRRVTQASWSGQACAITTASASMLTAWLIGRDIGEIGAGFSLFEKMLDGDRETDISVLGEMRALGAVGRFPSRRRNATLPWKAALKALDANAA